MTSDQRQSLPPIDEPGSFSGKGLPAGPLGRGGRDDLSAEEFADSDVGTEPQRVAPGEPVAFVPEWGRNRMRGMLEGRPDWCISRQRAWGLPIPAFFTQEGEVLLTAASVRAVAKVLREEGSDAWFKNDAEHLLRHYDVGSDPDVPPSVASSLYGGGGRSVASLTKSRDIIDVWFESGSSWNAVMRERSGGGDFPVDLYLEGSDQHRGWFQSSLLPALAMMGRPPYRTVLTHGFMVDREGLKLSKSKGHTIEQLMELHGADVLRWWVASLAYEGDVKVDEEFFKLAGESYRKARNTLRFMLGNVGGVRGQAEESAPRGGGVAEESARGDDLPEAESLDAWVLGEYDTMARGVVEAYLRYDFKGAQQALYHFCNETLSSVYLAAVKDRLYCDAVDEPRRRRTQRTLFALTDGLCRLLAPVLCHTADEAWRELHGVEATDAERSVHLELFIEGFGARPAEAWKAAMRVRERALVALERAKERGIENPLDARLVLPDADGALGTLDGRDLADICGVSLVELDPQAQEVRVEDLRERYPRCERSWKRGPDVRERSDGGVLTDRDARAVGVS